MTFETLISGLQFAVKHEMTKKEMEVLIPFLHRSSTTSEVAKILMANPSTLHHTIKRLKLKGLLILDKRDSNGNNFYRFNKNSLIV